MAKSAASPQGGGKAGGPVCISVINMKGGVGKTTVAALLGRYASLTLGLKVLAIDLDPQANLSQAFMGDARYKQFLADKSPSVVELFKGFRPPSPSKPAPAPLTLDDVVIQNTALGGRGLQLIPSRFDFADQLISALRPDEHVLANVIATSFQSADVVLIDCPPTESILTRVSYQASRYLLVPVRPEFFATIGFPLLLDSLGDFKSANRGHAIDVSGVVINNSSYHYSGNRGGPERHRSIASITSESEANGWHVFENEIPFSRGFPKIMRGDFSHSGDAVLFRRFAGEFFRHIGLRGQDDD